MKCATVALIDEADGFFREAQTCIRNVWMQSYRKELWFNAPTRRAFINITPDVQKCIEDSRVSEGLVLFNAKRIWL